MNWLSVKLLSLIFILVFLSSTLFAKPAIQISETTFDFGKTAQHVKISHTFWIKSTGDEDLIITKVVPGCGCTKAPIKDTILAPGDSTSIEIIFSTKSFRGFVSKRPYLLTNISDEKYYLKIHAELLIEPEESMPISLKPYKLDVSQFRKQPRRRAKFLIENKSDRDYALQLVDGKDKYFEVTIPTKIKAGETVEGMVEVHKNAIEKEFEQSLTFEIVNEVERSRFTLPVKRTYKILNKDKK